jgi:hypothetical protein
VITDERLDHALRDWYRIEGSQRAPEALLDAVLDRTRRVAPRPRWSVGAIPMQFGLGAVAIVTAAVVLFGVVWRVPSSDDRIGAPVSGPVDVTFHVIYHFEPEPAYPVAGEFHASGTIKGRGSFGDQITREADGSYTILRTLRFGDGTIESVMSVRNVIELSTSESVNGTFTIVGGSGRFAGITGSGSVATGSTPGSPRLPVGSRPERWIGSVRGVDR